MRQIGSKKSFEYMKTLAQGVRADKEVVVTQDRAEPALPRLLVLLQQLMATKNPQRMIPEIWKRSQMMIK